MILTSLQQLIKLKTISIIWMLAKLVMLSGRLLKMLLLMLIIEILIMCLIGSWISWLRYWRRGIRNLRSFLIRLMRIRVGLWIGRSSAGLLRWLLLVIPNSKCYNFSNYWILIRADLFPKFNFYLFCRISFLLEKSIKFNWTEPIVISLTWWVTSNGVRYLQPIFWK